MTTSTIDADRRGADGTERPSVEASSAAAEVDSKQRRAAVRRALGKQLRHQRRPLALAIALGMVDGGCAVLQAWVLARTLAAVFLDGAGLPDVAGQLLAYAALAMLRAGCRWWGEVAAEDAAQGVKAALRSRLTERLLSADLVMASGIEAHSGRRGTLWVEGVEALHDYVGQYVPRLGLAVGLPLMFMAVVAGVDGVAAVTLLLTVPLIPLFMVLVGSRARVASRRQWVTLRRLGATFLDVLQGLPTLKLLGQSRRQMHRLEKANERFRRLTLDILRVAFLSALILELVATLSVALVAVGVGLRLLHGWLDFETALFVLLLAPEAYAPLRALGAAHHAAMAGQDAAESLFEVLADDAPQDDDRSAAKPVDEALDGPPKVVADEALRRGPLELLDVGLDFGSRRVLRRVRLTLRRGEVTALVGASGAGKSTIGHLLLGLLQPSVGGVEIGGHDLQTLDGDRWRRHVAWVPQHPHVFAAGLAENMRLARADADDEEIRQALDLAGLGGLEKQLEGGLAAPLGERGSTLSGGQVRRLALARAILRRAPWWILDEPTEHLDGAMQEQVMETLRHWAWRDDSAAPPGVLIIAHRRQTLHGVDRVVELKDGELVAADGSCASERLDPRAPWQGRVA